ncbi:MAG: PPOX class F420-dependent oxidoreductase [Caldilineaceae bacterium]|nr:PPOX class F420-dependent oxidoreductase [Caldilineaceae bacterium]
MTLNDIKDAKYIALKTFRRNGQGVITPVWMAADGGKLYVWTDGSSGKVKRIRNDGRVRLCASDVRGTPTGEWTEAQARVLEQPTDVQATAKRIAAKYGLMFHLFGLMGKLRGRGQNRVAIEISPLSAS